jgi:pimeloyl-ACP methyl ester carboxylesterase
MRNQTRPSLRSVAKDAEPSLQFRTIHGHRRAFRIAGSGPAILMIHGVGDSSATWSTVHAKLARRFTVIAPDLLGHGDSDKPRADYSVAAFANGMRDLLTVLGIERVTVIGHSLGGGIAGQFAYQYPHFVERVILVAAGGVTKDVNPALRLAALPMGAEALAALRLPGAMTSLRLVGRAAKAVLGATQIGRDLPDLMQLVERLRDPAALSAFSHTLRGAVDGHGQFVTMLDRSYLMETVPTQLIWGENDPIIPASHVRIAHEAMPASQLEIFEDSGHMPHHDDPDRFVDVVERFIDSTWPAVYNERLMSAVLKSGPAESGTSAPAKAASRGA